MKEKVIAIYCGNSSEEDINMIQTYFFEEGIGWYSSKFNYKNKYKKHITQYLVVVRNDLMEGDGSVLDGISDIAKVIRFNTPIEFLRHHKIKKLKTKLK